MSTTRLKTRINRLVCRGTQLLWCVLLLFIFSSSFFAHAQERLWWFEIEVLLFKRDINPNDVSEAFDSSLQPINTENAIDLVTPFLTPDLTWTRDSLPYCLKAPLPPLELTGVAFVPNSLLTDNTLSIDQIGVLDLSGGLIDSMLQEQEALLDQSLEDENTQSNSLEDNDSYLADEVNTEQAESVPADETYTDPTPAYIPRFEHLELVMVEPEPVADPNNYYQGSTDFDTDIDSGTGFQEVLTELAEPLEEITFTLVNYQLPRSLACVYESEQLQFNLQEEEPAYPEVLLTQIPQRMSGVEWLYSDDTYLLSKESLKLTGLARQISRQRGTSSLLHLGWRQEVLFGQDKAPFYRLFGGKNYATEYALDGEKLIVVEQEMLEQSDQEESLVSDSETSSQDLLDKIKLALEDPDYQAELNANDTTLEDDQQRTAEMWEVDGLFKVFLRYIQGVPYLHIESELDYRAPVFNSAQNTSLDADLSAAESDISLQQFRFSQLRRVISTQVHYFDHPLFGMVVQIRRFDKPQKEETIEQYTSEEALTQ